MNLVYLPKFCITFVFNFSVVRRENEDNGYAKFFFGGGGGKQGAIGSMGKGGIQPNRDKTK